MTRNAVPFVSTLALGLLLGAPGAVAQDRAALVIANTGYAGDAALPDLRRATEKMSETLFGLGFSVDRLENATLAEMQAALDALGDRDASVVVYYAGHGFTHDGTGYVLPVAATGADAAALAGQALPAADLTADGWVTILDTCHGTASQGLPGQGALALPDQNPADALVIAAVAPGVACPVEQPEQLTTVLLDRLTVPGLPSTELLPPMPAPEPTAAATDADPQADEPVAEAPAQLAGFFTQSTRAEPFVFRRATSGARLTQKDYEMLENISPSARAQLLAMWEQAGIAVDFAGETPAAPTTVGTVTNDTVVLSEPVRPVVTGNAVAPVSVAAAGVSQVTDGVQVLTVAPQRTAAASTPRPVPGAGGLPRPSIIVGYPEELTAATFDVVADDDPNIAGGTEASALGGSEISYENVALRRDFAENNRDLYLSLVDSGAFDPPQAQMAVALQTELQRMNCYTNRIDGDWGPGSRRSVGRYYEQIGSAAPTQDASLEIWRQLMIKDDVRCPDVVVAQPRRTTSSASSSSSSSRTTTSSAPRRQPAAQAPAPAPQPAAPARRTISTSSGTGVFR